MHNGAIVKIDYRDMARSALLRAKKELASDDDDRLPYAALELRQAMESLTYDRAQSIRNEIPPEEYRTWQPRKLVRVMADIDPSIMRSSILRFGRQTGPGEKAERMTSAGTETVLTAGDLKAHYDSLGNKLHIPTLAQFEDGKLADATKVRAQCEEAVAVIARVLGSPIWNITISNTSTIACMRCNEPIHRRLPHNVETLEVECFECRAQYTVTDEGDGKVLWQPNVEDAPCANAACTGTVALWPNQLKAGTWWTCKVCGTQSEIQLRIAEKGAD